MFVAMSSFTVANGMSAQTREAFRNRPHRVDSAPGFVRMDVLNPVDAPEQFTLVTYWEDELSFRRWHQSHQFRDAHQEMPKGLKLDPSKTILQFYEHLAS